MRIHLDDSLAIPVLARLLRNAGHDIQLPGNAGLSGADAIEHLTHAIRHQRVCMSRFGAEYLRIHDLIGAAQGQHAGILIVLRVNDPSRDLTYRGMVRALGNLEAAGYPMTDQFELLNRWH